MNVRMFYNQLANTPINYLTTINNTRLWIKRDDLNDKTIQGNKLRKLKGVLHIAEEKRQGLLSFGGAYSNHIDALASAGQRFNLRTCGIIRGQELSDPKRQSHTIKRALKNGMDLYFVTRKEYQLKEKGETVNKILQINPTWWIIPEGGSHQLALQGASEIVDEIAVEQLPFSFDKVFCACGTGGTLAGILQGALKNHLRNTHFVGVPVLKGANFLHQQITALFPDAHRCRWSLELNAHGGGYAKTSKALLGFIKNFEDQFNIALDPIYTGKLCKAVFELAQQNTEKEENWLIYHSGGIQGSTPLLKPSNSIN